MYCCESNHIAQPKIIFPYDLRISLIFTLIFWWHFISETNGFS